MFLPRFVSLPKICMNFCRDFIPKLAFLQVNDQTRDQTKASVALEKSNVALIVSWLMLNVYLSQIWISWQMGARLLVAMTTPCQTVDIEWAYTTDIDSLWSYLVSFKSTFDIKWEQIQFGHRVCNWENKGKSASKLLPRGCCFKARLDYVIILNM